MIKQMDKLAKTNKERKQGLGDLNSENKLRCVPSNKSHRQAGEKLQCTAVEEAGPGMQGAVVGGRYICHELSS